MLREAAVLALTCAVVAGTASAAPTADLRIRPGLGIGKLRLGMTQAEVQRAMGRPSVVIRRSASFGRRALEWQYGFAEYRVTFFGPRGRLRATRIGTTLRRERTPRRVGVGSHERDVRRVYPAIRCERFQTVRITPTGPAVIRQRERSCTLFAPSGRRTIFTSTPSFTRMPTIAEWHAHAEVVEVAVAEPR